METAHDDICTAPPIVLRDLVRAVCRRDVDLDDDEIRRILQVQPLDMFILYFSVIVVGQITGEYGKAERRKQ
jgi:hypothetical protein